ncbi:MAG: Eco57I restriction-modification methylase domain-containing protein, partial [Chloroflexota bacterium]
LQQAIDKLARVDGQFVDYRNLAVRHLGTIYEGLLEYHLEARAEGTWTVALLNDKGERHATGSYYTPDYVVKYIVDQTLGPALDDAVEAGGDDQSTIDAILALNVLDPAMGSGHFLVEATEYIARRLVELDLRPPGAGEAQEDDLDYWKRRVAQSCIYGVDANPLAVELAKLSLWLATVAKDRPLSFLDHHLRPGNSLVGARIADLRADASLTGGQQKRTRRSKQNGPTKAQQQAGVVQPLLLDDDAFRQAMSTAVGSMWLIEESPGLTVADVKEQERIYHDLRETLTRKYGRLADLVTARWFGLDVDVAPEEWGTLADYATGRTISAPRQFLRWLDEAEAIANDERRRFFHWELEFPEVFFDRRGYPRGEAAGFDAVIGNPPYVRQEALGPYKPYFAGAHGEVYQGTADLFVYFIGQGMRQLRPGGRLGYISSNSWLRANYATPLRAYLRTQITVEAIVDLGDNRVFADAPDVYPAIVILRRELPPAEHSAQVAVFTRGEGLAQFETRVATKLLPVSIHSQTDTGWQLHDVEHSLFQKLIAGGEPLGEVVAGRMYYGIKTGLNEAFIVDQATRDRLVATDPACSGLLKPML